MPRTTVSQVQGVLGRNWDGATDLQPFIDTATVIVDQVVSIAGAKLTPATLSDAQLELIERWLSAHCYTRMDQLFSSKSTGGASASFQGQTAMYLESTVYGQMAMSVDTSGALRILDKRAFAQGVSLSSPRRHHHNGFF
jgi:hypothetical protein